MPWDRRSSKQKQFKGLGLIRFRVQLILCMSLVVPKNFETETASKGKDNLNARTRTPKPHCDDDAASKPFAHHPITHSVYKTGAVDVSMYIGIYTYVCMSCFVGLLPRSLALSLSRSLCLLTAQKLPFIGLSSSTILTQYLGSSWADLLGQPSQQRASWADLGV